VLSAARSNQRARRLRLKTPLFLALVGLMLGIGVAELCSPLADLREQHKNLARLRQEKAALGMETGRLEEHKGYLATEAGQEATARRQGYVRPGERRLVFVAEDASGTSDRPTDRPQTH
jgi:cell division protein FtsB